MLARVQRALSILLAAAAVLPARAQERSLRLVERALPAATVAPPTPWPTDFAAALAAAKQRHVLLLMFFTAKW